MGLGLLQTQKVVEAQRDLNLPGGLLKDFLEVVTCERQQREGRGHILGRDTRTCEGRKCANAGPLRGR